MRRARPYRPQNLRWNALRALGKLAVPEAVRGVLTMGGFMLFLRLHSELGTTELAAGTILVNLASMGFLPSMGMGLAGATLVGRHLGKGDPDQARRAVWEGVKLSMLILLPALLLMLGFPDTVLGLFTPDPTVIELARVPLRLLGAMMGLDALPIVLVFSLLGAGITRWVAAVNLVQQYVILLPVAWLLGVQLQLGILGLWLGMGLSRVALALVVVPKFRSRSWESQQV